MGVRHMDRQQRFSVRRLLRRVAALTAAFIFFSSSAAFASVTTAVEDSCKVPGSGLFYAAGPAIYWVVVKNVNTASAGCYLWTSQVPSGYSPVNWANWYLPVDHAHDGNYDVVPYIVNNANAGAYNTIYWLFQKGTQNGVPTTTQCVNQAGQRGRFVTIFSNWHLYEDSNRGYAGYSRIVDPVCGVGHPGGSHIAVDLLYYVAR